MSADTALRRVVVALFFRAGQHHAEGLRWGSMVSPDSTAPSRLRYASDQLVTAGNIASVARELQEYERGVR